MTRHPPILGGQGRDAESVLADAATLVTVACAAVIFVAYLIFGGSTP